jgi:hypothetical protein
LNGLGDEWNDVLGQGTNSTLTSSSQTDPASLVHLKNRIELFEAVDKVRQFNSEQGKPPMTREQEVQWGLMQCFPDKFQQSLSAKPNQTRNVVASRPTQRHTPPRTQNDKTLEAVNAMMKKKHGRGIDMGSSDSTFEGEI